MGKELSRALMASLQEVPDGEEGNGTSQPSPDKKVWVDRDRVISSTIRTATAQINAFKEKARETLAKLKASFGQYKVNAEQDADFKKNFAGELKILEVRVDALEIVVVWVSVVCCYCLRPERSSRCS